MSDDDDDRGGRWPKAGGLWAEQLMNQWKAAEMPKPRMLSDCTTDDLLKEIEFREKWREAMSKIPVMMPMPRSRPAECFEHEDVYRWLLAEARWLLGPVADAMHRIRLREHIFEHDSVQRDCDLGQPPPDQG